MDFLDRRRRVWPRVGECYTDSTNVAHDRYGEGSVMVWGGITMTGKTDLHVCQGRVTCMYYLDNVLAPYVIPFAQRQVPGFIFQDDNARSCYRLPSAAEYSYFIVACDDLSPIEHVWGILGKRVRRHTPQPRTLGELGAAL